MPAEAMREDAGINLYTKYVQNIKKFYKLT